MRKIVIFSGTTEGRKLSSLLSEANIAHDVCVATQYGADVMEESAFAKVHTGPMDVDEMKAFLKRNGYTSSDLILDATHPYAMQASENIAAAAKSTDIPYIRIIRERAKTEDAICYDSAASCAQALRNEDGNILLTTGVKELHEFCTHIPEEMKGRIYVRILPSEESIKACRTEGIDPGAIIAMQGPFTIEMNRAVFAQYGIRHLITKESGTAGGFPEKLQAAEEEHVKCHIISRPGEEEGISVYEAYEQITEKRIPKEIVLIGCGCGGKDQLTAEAKSAIDQADVVFGASRLIKTFGRGLTFQMYRAEDILPILQTREEIRKAVILFSGDSGFYSGAKNMIRSLQQELDIMLRVLPGISSVSALSARTLESYDDAILFSLHGRTDPNGLQELMHKLRHNRKTFVLLSGDADVNAIGKALLENRIPCRIFLGRDLSYETETLFEVTPEEAAGYNDGGVLTALLINDEPERKRITPVLKDEELIRGNVPMTKESIRHESILELDLREGDVLYDVGGGTGSVAIEAALLSPTLRIYSFEQNEEAFELIRANAEKFKTANVTPVRGCAPEAFSGIENPDCVFIGGSGGKLREILQAVTVKKRNVRYVLNAVTMETIDETGRLLTEFGATDIRIRQVAVSDVVSRGAYHMLQAQNPVMIFSFVL